MLKIVFKSFVLGTLLLSTTLPTLATYSLELQAPAPKRRKVEDKDERNNQEQQNQQAYFGLAKPIQATLHDPMQIDEDNLLLQDHLSALPTDMITRIVEVLPIKDAVMLGFTNKKLSSCITAEACWKQFAKRLPGYTWAISYNPDFEKNSKSAFQFLLEPCIAEPKQNNYLKLESTSMIPDGTKVVGHFNNGKKNNLRQAFLWMPDHTGHKFQALETWEEPYNTKALQISADGNKIIGEAYGKDLQPKFVFWDKDGKIHLLDAFNKGHGHRPIAWDANLNRIITYSLEPDEREPTKPIDYDDDTVRVEYRLWNLKDDFTTESSDNSEGFEPVPFEFKSEDTIFRVTAMSSDGRTVVGYRAIHDYLERGIWWQLEGKNFLGKAKKLPIANEEEEDKTFSVNADGTLIGGRAYHFIQNEDHEASVFRSVVWKQKDGSFQVQQLFVNPPQDRDNDENYITHFNAKGDVIIGEIGNVTEVEPYMWTQNTGMVYLLDILQSKLSNQQADISVNAISADGTIIVGTDFNAHKVLLTYVPHFPTFEEEGLPLSFLGNYKNHPLNKMAENNLLNQSGINSGDNGSMSDDMDVEESEN